MMICGCISTTVLVFIVCDTIAPKSARVKHFAVVPVLDRVQA